MDMSAGADLRDAHHSAHADAHAQAAARSSPGGLSHNEFSMIGFEPAFARPVPPLLQVPCSWCSVCDACMGFARMRTTSVCHVVISVCACMHAMGQSPRNVQADCQAVHSSMVHCVVSCVFTVYVYNKRPKHMTDGFFPYTGG